MRRASMERLAWARRHLRDLGEESMVCYPFGLSGHQLELLVAKGYAVRVQLAAEDQPALNRGREPTAKERKADAADRAARPFSLYVITDAGQRVLEEEPDTWR